MRIGAFTMNWNREQFLVPHLQMMTGLDRRVVLQGTAPWGHRKELRSPDRSEEQVRKMLPDVEIVEAVENEFTANVLNQGMEILSDCDIVLKLDSDMFLTAKDWATLLQILQEDQVDAFRLSYQDCSIRYVSSVTRGIRDETEEDIIALRQPYRFTKTAHTNARSEKLIRSGITVHHLRSFTKGVDTEQIGECLPVEIYQQLTQHWENEISNL